MEKLKNNGVIYVAISLVIVCLLGLSITASASQTFKQMLADSLAKVLAPQVLEGINLSETVEEFGAVSGPDYTWDYQNFNGLTTYVKTGGFAKGTTTLACVKNPFGATSTLDLAEVNITGYATNTFQLIIGTSTAAVGQTTSTIPNGILSASITGTTTGQAINNINYAVAGTYAGGSVARMVVGWNEYVCIVGGDNSSGSASTLTSSTDLFKGNYKLRFVK